MKHNLLSLLLIGLFCSFSTMCSAVDRSDKNLHFVYIDHETTTPVQVLCDKLQELHDDAQDVDDALIIYLSDGKSSAISFTNLKDFQGSGRDSEDAFDNIIGALQDANSHDVTARLDIENIFNLFSEYNFVDENRQLTYPTVTFDFYVGSNFWSLGNNEKVIAHLYTAFDMKSLPKDGFTLNIFTPRGELLSYEEGKPFGDNDVEGINKAVKILQY